MGVPRRCCEQRNGLCSVAIDVSGLCGENVEYSGLARVRVGNRVVPAVTVVVRVALEYVALCGLSGVCAALNCCARFRACWECVGVCP